MGRSHALSGWVAGLVVAPFVGLNTVAEVVPFAVATAGYALVPDLDHPGASASRVLGPITGFVSGAVRAFSGLLYAITKGPRDEDSTGRHRHASHTLAAAIALGFLTSSVGATGGWRAVLAVALFGLILAADVLGDWVLMVVVGTGAWTLAGSWLPGTTVTQALQGGLAEIGSWIGVAVAVGMFVHCLGDSLTRSGCPWLWPLPIRGETWYEIRLPRALRFRTGGWVENGMIAPALVVAGVLLLPGAWPLVQQVFDAILSTTSVWIAGGQ
ncbi:metal-dependent hydrolase [Kribbella sancticallisti]|uniref:Metal-dependent hydrolase n=1 Tax=Kribbella sancticallisti TaxID=460087 RepID=A0ABP4QG02_9ACTN